MKKTPVNTDVSSKYISFIYLNENWASLVRFIFINCLFSHPSTQQKFNHQHHYNTYSNFTLSFFIKDHSDISSPFSLQVKIGNPLLFSGRIQSRHKNGREKSCPLFLARQTALPTFPVTVVHTVI